jgi:hypothetical protein
MPDTALSTTLAEINTITIIPSWATITFIHERRRYVTLEILIFVIRCSTDHYQQDVHDSGINKYVGSDDCQAAPIVSTTTFVTTNVTVAAPYLGILDCNSENLTVKMYVFTFAHCNVVHMIATLTPLRPSVRYTFFSD